MGAVSVTELRPKGELAVTHRHRNAQQVLAPAGAPVAVVYRDGCYMVKISETTKTGELPGLQYESKT